MRKKINYKFSGASTDVYYDHRFSDLKNIVDRRSTILITDENVYNAHSSKFKGWSTIILKPGEEYKIQATVDSIIDELITMEADRHSCLVGVGGGVLTDLTGYVASIYMRGIKFGFVPTSLLALVDASIGGKNGIDIGVYKNMAGVIRQPAFILHDLSLLNTLPKQQWENGFAEVIKHACILDSAMFKELEKRSIEYYKKNRTAFSNLVEKNVMLKTRIVQRDEFEKKERRLLNFGHTIGHALENQYELLHGQAVSIGMSYASNISKKLLGFKDASQVRSVLEQYGLPVEALFNKQKVIDVLKMDKKRQRKEINYILLQKIGKAVVQAIPVKQLERIVREL